VQLEVIWAAYKGALKRFLHSKISSEADVEDLLQDILIKTYNNLGTVKDQTSVKSWLFQIANHTIVDFYRAKARQQKLSINEHQLVEEPENVKAALSNCLVPFINALPSQNAELLSAIDINNQSQKEYAEQHNISYSTLKSRVQKSREMLKDVFDECCHFHIDKSGSIYDYEQKPSWKKIK